MHHHPLRRTVIGLGTALVLVVSAACGDDDVETTTGDSSEDAVTQPDQPTSSPDDPADDFGEDFSAEDAEEARQRARDLLGTSEVDLPDDVRVRRRGDEQFMLTEDYVLGRVTVELDDDRGTFVVTTAVVELPDGPETFDGHGG